MTIDLNRWSGELMGWQSAPYARPISREQAVEELAYLTKDGAFVCYVRDWTPLTDINQLKVVIERMRELGWELIIIFTIGKKTVAKFVQFETLEELLKIITNVYEWSWDIDLNTAVLMAAYEAMRKEK